MKNILLVIGMTTLLALSMLTFFIFLSAYLSPAKTVVVHINNYGEADAELLLLSVILPLNIVVAWLAGRKITAKETEKIS